jgi:hypothetical protein
VAFKSPLIIGGLIMATKKEMLNELSRLYDLAVGQGWEDIAEAIAVAENTVISGINFEKREGMKWQQ